MNLWDGSSVIFCSPSSHHKIRHASQQCANLHVAEMAHTHQSPVVWIVAFCDFVECHASPH